MIEFPIWAVVVLSVLAFPTAAIATLCLADAIIDLIDRRKGK